MPENNQRLYIKTVAREVNRREATIRGWERDKILPADLLPHRDERDWRYWTQDQVDGIIVWLEEADMRPGKGLPHYKPDREKLRQHIENQRKKRNSRG